MYFYFNFCNFDVICIYAQWITYETRLVQLVEQEFNTPPEFTSCV